MSDRACVGDLLLDSGGGAISCHLAAIRAAYLTAPEEAVFLERARILAETKCRHGGLPPGLRQGRVLQDLCNRISVIVSPEDVLLGRVREEVPAAEDEEFVREHPDLFSREGVPGWLESASIYAPDWARLLRVGLGGLLKEVEEAGRRAAPSARDELEGIRLSLLAVSALLGRYAGEARRVAQGQEDEGASARLLRAAQACEAVALGPPGSLQEALQLFIAFHMALSCLVGGRNVTPGRMDQYLVGFYEKDLAAGTIRRPDAVKLIAAMMLMLSQLSGSVATDFQSKKRTPNRFSHYYVTLGGVKADGTSAVNELSHVFLEARRLVEFRDPSLSIRYFPGIERGFWRKAVALLRDGLPAFTYNDPAVIAAQEGLGVPRSEAAAYAHCGCMVCFLPGRDLPTIRVNHNGPGAVLRAMNGVTAPAADEPGDFESFFAAFRGQLRASLQDACRRYASPAAGPCDYPLLARCLREGYLRGALPKRWADQHLVGFATTVDSLLAVREVVYRRQTMTLPELAAVLQRDFSGSEALRAYLMNRLPSYGSDDPEVAEMTRRLSTAWVEEVAAAGAELQTIALRPGFHSWLYNIELGKATGATPDGRRQGAPLSADIAPMRGRSRAPTEVLRAMAAVCGDHTCSGGTTFRISPSHFKGDAGVDRLASLVEAHFAEGGLQLHFIVADSATLRDAVANPDENRDLLVRVAGFSEYFVRLLPEVQQEIIQRVQHGGDA